MQFPIVYLPIEFRSREFDARVLLAATLAERGYSVVMGQQWMLGANIARLPPGVFLFKGFNKIHQVAMQLARQAGHRVAVLEEEMLGQIEERAVTAMCADGLFETADLVLADGAFEADLLRQAGGEKFRLEIAGNGRIDILKARYRSYFEKPISEVKSRFGDFVLVNTNFQIVNSIWKDLDQVTRIQIQAGYVKMNDPASMKTWQDYIAFEDANRAAMYAAIRLLAQRRPAQRIVVRPHPGEDLKRWDGLYADCKNVTVVREGSHVPWTFGCRLLLHSSCTTGFEAYVGGKPALSLVPNPGWISGSMISNQVNPTYATAEEFVAAAESALDGAPPPVDAAKAAAVERYVWNSAANDGTQRLADLLVEGLPAPKPVLLPPLQGVPRDARLREKFDVTLADGQDSVRRMAEAAGIKAKIEVQQLGDSLFLVRPPLPAQPAAAPAPAAAAKPAASPAPAAAAKPSREQILAAIDGAYRARNFAKVYETFKQYFGEAHRHPQACFMAGMALFELGQYPLALQYIQQSTVAEGAQNVNATLMLARIHQKTGEYELARRFAEQTWRIVPTENGVFDLLKEVATQAGTKPPDHWLVIGCSHVRYFRYLQVNQPKFFDWAVHLECLEFAGATAFGLGNAASQSGALKATREAQPRMRAADRVIVHFGEIDCRRAAWKASVTENRPIEQTIADSAAHLETYVRREILPHNDNVLILGAKPQIIGDEDFYRNSLEDERTIFKPLPERERVTRMFNDLLRQSAARLDLDYADIDHVLNDEASRQRFFSRVFWDTYTDDTHGNADTFGELYCERLKPFIGARRRPKA